MKGNNKLKAMSHLFLQILHKDDCSYSEVSCSFMLNFITAKLKFYPQHSHICVD